LHPDGPANLPEPVNLREGLAQLLGSWARAEEGKGQPTFRVSSPDIHAACERAKAAGFDYLMFVTAVDYPDSQKFELVYGISNYHDGAPFFLVSDVPRDHPRIGTVSDLWATADWHEREVYDLFGIVFEGHPDLRRILLDDDWEGHPLRKDYVDTLHQVVKRPY
jgi:NADH-quinone oxidoreductase subunit C